MDTIYKVNGTGVPQNEERSLNQMIWEQWEQESDEELDLRVRQVVIQVLREELPRLLLPGHKQG